MADFWARGVMVPSIALIYGTDAVWMARGPTTLMAVGWVVEIAFLVSAY